MSIDVNNTEAFQPVPPETKGCPELIYTPIYRHINGTLSNQAAHVQHEDNVRFVLAKVSALIRQVLEHEPNIPPRPRSTSTDPPNKSPVSNVLPPIGSSRSNA